MNELLLSITYPPIPITQVGPFALSLHGVFAAVGFYFGASHAIKLAEKDGADSELFFGSSNLGYFWCYFRCKIFYNSSTVV